MEVVAEAEDGVDAFEQALKTKPDLCVMDVSMPRMTGLQAARQIRAHLPGTQVLALSMHDDERYVFDALKAGASGYVLKREVDQALLSAIRAVHRGDAFLTNAVERSLIRDWMSSDAEGPDEPLSPREQEVLKLIAEAHTNKQIAEILHLAEKTVESHRANLLRKLGHARPGRARALRDPAGADRGVGAAPRQPAGGRGYAQAVPARLAFALLTLTLCAVAAVAGVVLASRGDGRRRGDVAVGTTGWAGFVRPPGATAPDFRLRDQDGEPVTMAEYRGRPVAVTFVYSTCEDTCPALVDQVRGALDDTGADVPLLAVSVDPANDTPARARRFLNERRMTGRRALPARRRARAAAGLEGLRRGAAARASSTTRRPSCSSTATGRQRVGFPHDQLTPEALAHDIGGDLAAAERAAARRSRPRGRRERVLRGVLAVLRGAVDGVVVGRTPERATRRRPPRPPRARRSRRRRPR